MVDYGIILDALVAVLLIATIFYAAALSRRLNALRDNRREMEFAVRRFAEASMKADASIKGLKRTADESGSTLQQMTERAQTLRDELAFLVEAAETVAERLENGSGTQRQSAPATPPPEPPPAPSWQSRPAPAEPATAPAPARKSQQTRGSDQDLIRAIENMR